MTGATVTLGREPAIAQSITSNTISAVTPATFSSGAVDVVVTNPDGRSARLSHGFEFVFDGPPSIVQVTASPGSSEGGASFTISGTNFDSRSAVRFDGALAPTAFDQGQIFGVTPPHTPGAVDVTVTNPDGQTARAAGAYTYVDPGSLDFNGEWEGYSGEMETFVRFVVRNDQLTEFACGPTVTDPTVAVDVLPPAAVINGAVSFSASEGSVNGRIVTGTSSVGFLQINRCFGREVKWFAQKR